MYQATSFKGGRRGRDLETNSLKRLSEVCSGNAEWVTLKAPLFPLAVDVLESSQQAVSALSLTYYWKLYGHILQACSIAPWSQCSSFHQQALDWALKRTTMTVSTVTLDGTSSCWHGYILEEMYCRYSFMKIDVLSWRTPQSETSSNCNSEYWIIARRFTFRNLSPGPLSIYALLGQYSGDIAEASSKLVFCLKTKTKKPRMCVFVPHWHL